MKSIACATDVEEGHYDSSSSSDSGSDSEDGDFFAQQSDCWKESYKAFEEQPSDDEGDGPAMSPDVPIVLQLDPSANPSFADLQNTFLCFPDSDVDEPVTK